MLGDICQELVAGGAEADEGSVSGEGGAIVVEAEGDAAGWGDGVGEGGGGEGAVFGGWGGELGMGWGDGGRGLTGFRFGGR